VYGYWCVTSAAHLIAQVSCQINLYGRFIAKRKPSSFSSLPPRLLCLLHILHVLQGSKPKMGTKSVNASAGAKTCDSNRLIPPRQLIFRPWYPPGSRTPFRVSTVPSVAYNRRLYSHRLQLLLRTGALSRRHNHVSKLLVPIQSGTLLPTTSTR